MADKGNNLSQKAEAELAAFIAQFYADPYGFVMAAYPWGQKTLPDGSANPLANKKGPEPWQERLLKKLGRHIRENIALGHMGLEPFVWRSARASGHGVGKSALVAWLIHFLMSTRRDTRGTVTANTANQLETKTWPELSKWHNLLINKHWFTWTATSYVFSAYPTDRQKNYMVTAATVSAENTEAFAGLHNEGKTVFIIFDEASGIESNVWEVSDGAFTDGEGFFFAFGNPTRPDGEFADCFDKHAALYDTEFVDSRDVSHTNKQALNDIITKYGIDSDEVKIRVLGQFPMVSYNGFIRPDAVHEAFARELIIDKNAALIMAVDVARFGRDKSVIGFRQGRDARSIKFHEFSGLSITQLADKAMELANQYRPDAIVIEGTGVGAGVVDIMKDRGFRITEVHPGAAAKQYDHFFNRRAELWSKLRDWVYENGCLADDGDKDEGMFSQLTTLQYSFDRHEQRLKIENKEEYKKRTGLPSPDRADTLALTFAVHVARRDANHSRSANRMRQEAVTDYDPVTY